MSFVKKLEDKRDEHESAAEDTLTMPTLTGSTYNLATAHAVLALYYEMQIQFSRSGE